MRVTWEAVNDQSKTGPAAPAKGEGWLQDEELNLRRRAAKGLGGPEAVAKHHEPGRLTIRERMAALVDSGSFQEVGQAHGPRRSIRTRRSKGVMQAPYVMGLGRSTGGRSR